MGPGRSAGRMSAGGFACVVLDAEHGVVFRMEPMQSRADAAAWVAFHEAVAGLGPRAAAGARAKRPAAIFRAERALALPRPPRAWNRTAVAEGFLLPTIAMCVRARRPRAAARAYAPVGTCSWALLACQSLPFYLASLPFSLPAPPHLLSLFLHLSLHPSLPPSTGNYSSFSSNLARSLPFSLPIHQSVCPSVHPLSMFLFLPHPTPLFPLRLTLPPSRPSLSFRRERRERARRADSGSGTSPPPAPLTPSAPPYLASPSLLPASGPTQMRAERAGSGSGSTTRRRACSPAAPGAGTLGACSRR